MLLVACALCRGQSSANCLSYEPTVVRLEGTLAKKTFPGPPNYESIRKGDKTETYWLLNLAIPVCVDEDQSEPTANSAQKNIRIVQLLLSTEFYKTHAGLVGKHIIATGTLFGARTAHHHTPVLLTVSTLVEP